MNTIWKHIRKPLVWGPLFVLSVFAFNVLMGHKIGTTASYTFFAAIFAICMRNPSGEGYARRKDFLAEQAEHRRIVYGSSSIHSYPARKIMRGY